MVGSQSVAPQVAYSAIPEPTYPALVATYVPTVEIEPEAVVEAPKLDNTLDCNCYMYVRSKIPNLPLTKDLKPNSEIAVGAVAIFKYPSGLMHYAYVESFGTDVFTVDESNYKKCVRAKRIVKLDDKALLGFYK